MVRSVGYVLTCNRHFFAGSTIRAMLDLLRFMGRVSVEEVAHHSAEVHALSKRPGERISAGKGKVNQVWKATKATWVVYQLKSQSRLKLAQKAGVKVEDLLARHNLDAERVRAGKEGRDAEKRELRAQRKAAEKA